MFTGNNLMETYMAMQQQRSDNIFPAVQLPTVEHVKQFQPQRGKTMIVMAQDQPVFALKAADPMGLVQTAWYKYEAFNPEEQKPQYVTRQELEEIIGRLTEPAKPDCNGDKPPV